MMINATGRDMKVEFHADWAAIDERIWEFSFDNSGNLIIIAWKDDRSANTKIEIRRSGMWIDGYSC